MLLESFIDPQETFIHSFQDGLNLIALFQAHHPVGRFHDQLNQLGERRPAGYFSRAHAAEAVGHQQTITGQVISRPQDCRIDIRIEVLQ